MQPDPSRPDPLRIVDPEPDRGLPHAVLVEDDPLTRVLMTQLIDGLGFQVAAVNNVASAIDALHETDADLLITDLDLGAGPSGVHLIRYAESNLPWLAIVVLTAHRSTRLVDGEPLAQNPRRTHVVKGDVRSPMDLRLAIDGALRGLRPGPPPAGAGIIEISRGQAEILRLMAAGLSNREIARIRQCSIRAVENMAQRLYTTLGIAGNGTLNQRAAAIRLYQQALVTVS